MFFFAVGAIGTPLFASGLIERFGPSALFIMIAAGHALLIVFGLTRMLARPTAEHRTRYVYAPRTSFTVGRITKRQREKPNRTEETSPNEGK